MAGRSGSANTKVGEDWRHEKQAAAGAAGRPRCYGWRMAMATRLGSKPKRRDMTGLGQRQGRKRRAGNEGLGADDEHGYSSTAGSGRRQGKGEEGTVAPRRRTGEGGAGAPRARNALNAAPGVHAPRSSLPSLEVAAGPGAQYFWACWN